MCNEGQAPCKNVSMSWVPKTGVQMAFQCLKVRTEWILYLVAFIDFSNSDSTLEEVSLLES